MKKTLITLSIVFVALFCFVLVTGCDNNSNSLVGKWYYLSGKTVSEDIYYTFNKDNTGGYTFYDATQKFTYEEDETTVTISYEDTTSPNELKYSIKDGVLTIEDSFGDEVTYKKK